MDQPGLSCVTFNGVQTCVPLVPTWIVWGLIALGIMLLLVLLLLVLACIRKRKRQNHHRDAGYSPQRDVYMTDYSRAPAVANSPPGNVTVVRAEYAPRATVDPTRRQMLFTVQDAGPNILQARAGDQVIISVEDWAKGGEWVWAALPNGQCGWVPRTYVST